mgnify:CR=1 FL=1
MARTLLIMGESGAGKTTSARTLDPKTTLYIDCDRKGLSFKGWKKLYLSLRSYFPQHIKVLRSANALLSLIFNNQKFPYISYISQPSAQSET